MFHWLCCAVQVSSNSVTLSKAQWFRVWGLFFSPVSVRSVCPFQMGDKLSNALTLKPELLVQIGVTAHSFYSHT